MFIIQFSYSFIYNVIDFNLIDFILQSNNIFILAVSNVCNTSLILLYLF